MSFIAAGGLAVSAGLGVAQLVSANKRAKKAGEQKPFETSEEAYDMNQFAQNLAQGGFDAGTLAFYDNQIGRATSKAVGAVERTGGDPNDVSNIFDQQLQAIMKVGADNKNLQFENFNRYLNTLGALDENMGAEWASRENIRKDQLQAAQQQKADGIQNIGGAIQGGVNLAANNQQMKFFDKQISDLNASMAQSSLYPSVAATSNAGQWRSGSTISPTEMEALQKMLSGSPSYSGNVNLRGALG